MSKNYKILERLIWADLNGIRKLYRIFYCGDMVFKIIEAPQWMKETWRWDHERKT